MDTVCPACRRAGRPPVLEILLSPGRCRSCGALLPPVPAEDVTEEGTLPPVPPFSTGGAWMLRCQGRTWRIASDEVLRRWIVDRRVSAGDLVSLDGVRWEPVERQPALRDLLAVVARLGGSHATRPAGLKEASTPETGWTTAVEPEGAQPPPRSQMAPRTGDHHGRGRVLRQD
ncbi:MAG: hypothetical protein JXB39_13995 [Deltaproteobacteria bacterium]|nr:hypothetical protein [Deltaproteobacteria bacterium]